MNYKDIQEKVERIAKSSELFKIWNQEKNQTEQLKLTWGQKCMFYTILKRFPKRNHTSSFTRYGKSHTVAIAVLMRAVTHAEKWAIVAPSTSKAMIIMRNIIDHCYDSEIFRSQLDMDEQAKDKLRREVSKKRITFKNGGEIFVLSADNRNKAQAGDALMGFGCIVAGYKIMTDKGEMLIDDVVKNKEDVKILTFNHKTGKKEFKEILEYQENPRGNRNIYRIEVGDKSFECTEDHPIFIKGKGYIKAKNVKEGDEVYVN